MTRDQTESRWGLLVVLLLPTSHAFVPSPLAGTSLIVRSNSLYILHDTLNGSSGFVAVTIQCSLQKYSSASKDSALEPGHAITQVIKADLPASDGLPHSGDGNFPCGLTHGNLDHLLATPVNPTTAGLAALSFLDAIVVLVITKEARSSGAGRGTLHLSWEVAAREDTCTLAEAIWDLIGINPLEGYPDTEARSTHIIFDKDKLSLLGFRDIREKIVRLISVGSAMALSWDSASRMRSHMRHWRTSRIGLIVISCKYVGWSHIVVT